MALLERRLGARWRRLADGSANRRIFGAALIVGGGTAAVSLASVVRELLLAASFGTGDALDAFLIAFSLPTFVVNVLAGTFASALVPTLVHVREHEGREAADRLFAGAVALGLGFLVAAAAALALLLPRLVPFVASGFAPAKLAQTERLGYLLLPIVVVGGLAQMWGSVLNASERFALAALAPAAVPLAAVAALLLAPDRGIGPVVAGTLVGAALQLGLQGWGLAKQGIGLGPRWTGRTPALRRVVGQYLSMVAAMSLLSSTLLVDQAVAATLAPGSVASFVFGTKLVSLVVGLGAGALGTAVLPYFSRMTAAADWSQIRRTLAFYRRLTLLATVPLAALLVLLSEPLVALAFERGAFTATDTALVARVQALYALQIPFYVLVVLHVRLLSAVGANGLVGRSAAVGFLVNAGLDLLLARWFGVAGIAVATSATMAALLGVLSLLARRALAAPPVPAGTPSPAC